MNDKICDVCTVECVYFAVHFGNVFMWLVCQYARFYLFLLLFMRGF